MIRTICFFALFAFAVAASLSFDDQWESFKVEHGKVYSTAEDEAARKVIFEKNLKKINEHNKKADHGLRSYRMGVNKFTDMTFEEFKATHLGYRKSVNRKAAPLLHRYNRTAVLPKSVDWRSKSFVTPVKDQGTCGSCWAFSAIAAVESAHAQKTGKLVSLSEQNLIDCSWDYNDGGCAGGLMDHAFDYIKDNGGVDTETAYPYTSGDGDDSQNCKYKKSARGATIKSYVDLPENDEEALQEACSKGVVSIAMDAEDDLKSYKSGVFSSQICTTDPNHGVAVVGYGEENGTPYWIIKNSWGESWGESGYFRIHRGQNMCGIAGEASYPVV